MLNAWVSESPESILASILDPGVRLPARFLLPTVNKQVLLRNPPSDFPHWSLQRPEPSNGWNKKPRWNCHRHPFAGRIARRWPVRVWLGFSVPLGFPSEIGLVLASNHDFRQKHRHDEVRTEEREADQESSARHLSGFPRKLSDRVLPLDGPQPSSGSARISQLDV